MAYSDYQADRIRQRLRSVNVTEEKKMMGGLIFMVNDKMCVGVDKDAIILSVGTLSYTKSIRSRLLLSV